MDLFIKMKIDLKGMRMRKWSVNNERNELGKNENE